MEAVILDVSEPVIDELVDEMSEVPRGGSHSSEVTGGGSHSSEVTRGGSHSSEVTRGGSHSSEVTSGGSHSSTLDEPEIEPEIGESVDEPEIDESVDEPEIGELVGEMRAIVTRSWSHSSIRCLIYKVPYHIRKWNSDAYTPKVISVGPFHHRDPRLKDMEEVKQRYFSCFVRDRKLKVGDLVGKVMELEGSIRACYEGAIGFNRDRFVKMILVDAGFILELLFRHHLGSRSFGDPMEPRAATIIVDLILLENQLPFFVIEELYNLVAAVGPVPGLLELCFDYFGQFNICCIPPRDVEIKHFTDLLRTFRIPSPAERPSRTPPAAGRPERGFGMVSRLYTPTQLQKAGVRFKPGARRSVMCMKFEGGVLEIPATVLDDWEEIIARNIIALEQTFYKVHGYFTDYYIFMDLFIRTGEDVDLLSDKKIFSNLLSDGNAAVSMIKNLTKGILWVNVNIEYGNLCGSLNEFYEEPWHRQKAQIKRDYFSSPSATASAIFTVGVITVLALIQTVCSVLQVMGLGKG